MDISQPKVMVTKTSRKCPMCSSTIDENNWCLRIPMNTGNVVIHDNEGICLERLMVKLGLAEPSFLSSIPAIFGKYS
jgi:hypothetical protein